MAEVPQSASFPGHSAFRTILRRAIIWPVGTLVFALAALLAILLYLFHVAALADHSHAILNQISRVEKLVFDKETAVRSFLLTADPVVLEAFQQTNGVLTQEFDTLERLVAGDAHQVNQARMLRSSHADWADFATNLRHRIEPRVPPSDAAVHLRGKELLDTVRAHVNSMQRHERALLAGRTQTRTFLRVAAIVAVALFILVFAPLLFFSVRRALVRLDRGYQGALTSLDAERLRLRESLTASAAEASERRRAEETLLTERQRIHLLTDASQVGLWFWDMPSDKVHWDDRVKEHFWLPPYASVSVDVFYERLHPEDRERIRGAIAAALDKRSRYDVEYRTVSLDGREKWIRAIGHSQHDSAGNPVRFDGVTIDISEHKLRQEALLSSEERFRKVFEHAATGVAIADRDARFQQCNPALCNLLGYSREELYGRVALDLVHPDDRAECASFVQRVVAGTLSSYELENRYVHKNGQPVWVRKFISALRDASGTPTHLVGLFTDISERKRSAILLDSQKRSLEMLVSGAPLCDVLAFLARVVEEQSGGKAIASILLLDQDGLLRNGASPNLPGHYLQAIDGLRPSPEIGTCSAAAATGTVVITPDIDSDARWQDLKHLPLALGFVAAWSQPITASNGRVLGTFGTYFRECREPTVSERQAVEILARTAALAIERGRVEEDRNRFVSLAENSTDFIGMCGPDFLPFFINRAGLAMVGLDDLEVARRTPVREFFFPEDQEFVVNQFFPGVLAEGSRAMEIRFRHFKTGAAFWMLYTVWVVSDARGKFAGLATVSRDITGRKRAEEALRASEERYRSLFNSIDEGFCVLEVIFDSGSNPIDLQFVEINPAFERHSGLRAASGKRLSEFFPTVEQHWLDRYARVVTTGEAVRFVDQYQPLGWFDVYAFRIGPAEARRVAVLFNNVTRRKAAEDALMQSRAALTAANDELNRRARLLDETVEQRTAELRETIQQLETFSYSIVHDMRAPLRSMRSFAGFLQQRYTDRLDAPARDFVRRIMDSAARMDSLITDVLSYSKCSRSVAELTPVDLDRLVPEVIEQYPNLHDMTDAIEVHHPLPKVVGNPALLTQVFSNLLGNALKFVPEGRAPRVRVYSQPNHRFVRVWVEDNGIGVPAEHRERIFGLFQRLQRPEQYAGTGVGLAIVKRAAERMGGTAGVESADGQGSRFWVDLPVAAASVSQSDLVKLN